MDIDNVRKENTRTRVRIGYLMAILCAIFWGAWYVPGGLVFNLEPFVNLFGDGEFTQAEYIYQAILVTGINALFVVLVLMFWCTGLGKLKEMKRSVVDLKHCTKYYFAGAIFGGPMAILGTYIATTFGNSGFSAVSALCYPIIGMSLSVLWLHQKMSHRAIAGLLVILVGGIVCYSEGLFSGTIQPLGYVGGLMAIFGWGIEGAVAAKGLDASEPDVALTLRFVMECVIWWVITIPILCLSGVDMFNGIEKIFDPVTFLTLLMMGLTFGLCYVTWYKSFPLIGVGRGQAVGSLYGLMAIVFLWLFTGSASVFYLVGAIICIIGTFMLFTEKTDDMDSLRG